MNKVFVNRRNATKKEYYCSACGEKLVAWPRTRILDQNDPDYEEYSHFAGKRVWGKIEVTEYDFKCISCDTVIPYYKQHVIAKIQKRVGANTLTQNDIEIHLKSIKADLNRRQQKKTTCTRMIGIAIIIAILILGGILRSIF